MTYTFKLARRLAVSRRLGVITALVVLAACQGGESTAPNTGAAGSPASSSVLQIAPRVVTVEIDQRVQFRGQSRNWRGDLITIPVTWIATGGRIGADGVFSSGLAGTFRIAGRGRHGRQADSSTVVVVPRASDLARITVTPSTATVDTGAQRAFSVVGYRQDGSTAAIGVSWSATGGTVDPSGVYTAGPAAGSFHVIATNTDGTMADTVAVTVNAPPATPPTPPPANPPADPAPPSAPPAATLAHVIVTPASVSATTGGSRQFRAYGRNSAGDSIPVSVTFSGSGGTITSGGLYTAGPAAGTYRVVAAANGLADTAVVTLAQPPATGGGGSATGIPFGPSFFWLSPTTRETVGAASFSSSIVGTTAGDIVTLLSSARASHQRIVLNLTGGLHSLYLTGGMFDMAKWQAKMDTYNTPTIRAAVAAAVADGTILGSSVMDEPNVHGLGDGNTWGPVGTMTKARVDGLCTYVKTMFPTLPVGVVHQHDTFEPQNSYRVCEFIVDAYSSRSGSVTQFRDGGLALAARDGMGIIFSMNIMNGGTQSPRDGLWNCPAGTTGGRGTYGPNCRMTAAQVREFGQVLGVAGCAMLMWRYDRGFMADPDNQAALKDVAALLAASPKKSCGRR